MVTVKKVLAAKKIIKCKNCLSITVYEYFLTTVFFSLRENTQRHQLFYLTINQPFKHFMRFRPLSTVLGLCDSNAKFR